MSYFRRSLGDGPITSPSEVDPSLPFNPSGETTVGPVIGPTRRECWQLPSDSPWKRPGQACDPALDYSDMPFPITGPAGNGAVVLLVLLGAAGAAYYLTTRKKKRDAVSQK